MSGFDKDLTAFQLLFDSALKKSFSNEMPGELVEAASYSLMVGGKRIRPFLVRAAARACGITDESWMNPALAIEMIHTYSLIHDDLPAMDDDELRRGQPTCHIQYGEAVAILAGDGLQMKAVEKILETPEEQLTGVQKLQMVKSLSRASGFSGMVGGQALDLAAEGKTLNVDDLTRVHELKTGALIAAAVEMGCYCKPDVGSARISSAKRFGGLIGLAFQVIDDILDVEGSTEALGKVQGADIQHKKSTFPALMGLQQAKTHAKSLITAAITELDQWNGDTTELKLVAEFVLSRNH